MVTRILIVDDVPENISILFEFLIDHGFEVSIAPDGESALEVIQYETPDLILLDIMMPGIDGFETCRRLKAEKQYRDIPIIFMTALTDAVDKVKGFQCGAVDYVTKPVQQDEVLSRIKVHLTVRRLQLAHNEQNAVIRTLAQTISHRVFPQFDRIRYLTSQLRSHPETDATANTAESILQSTHRMRELIDKLLLLLEIPDKKMHDEPLVTHKMIQLVLDRLVDLRRQTQATIECPSNWPVAYGDAIWVEEIWTYYLEKSLTYSNHRPQLELGAEQQEEQVQFWIKDHGNDATETTQFNTSTPQEQPKTDDDLELFIIKRIAKRLGGQIGVIPGQPQENTFYFTLPAFANRETVEPR